MNLATLVGLQARSAPDRPAIEYCGQTLTYRQSWRQIVELSAWLLDVGAAPGGRIGLCLADHPQHVLLHFALARLGMQIVPLDHRWSAVEKQVVAASFGLQMLIVDDSVATVAGVHCEALDSAGQSPTDAPLPDAINAPDLPLLVSLSSGSTGKPKGAIVTHEQMLQRFVAQWVTLGFNAADRFAVVTPLCFGAGRSFAMSLLVAGATLIVSPPPHRPDELRDAIDGSAATATFLVPTMMRRLLELPGCGPLFPRLRRLLVSGETCHGTEIVTFQKRLTPNLIGYYATSEGGGISVLQPGELGRHGATVGRASYGVELQIVGADGEPLPCGETGLLGYRGPGVATRLLDENGEEQANDDHGWLYPGDLASIDSAGYVSLRGRERDMIVRGGVNVYPAEIEQTLATRPDIREVAVVGVPSTTHGEVVVACVAPDCGASDEELQDYCRERLAPYKIPSRWLRFDLLPRANSGKIDKKSLALAATNAAASARKR